MSDTGAPPIADLSYRNYDGPKSVRGPRWWPIARNGIRLTLRKKAVFWALFAFSWLPYVMIVFQLFISSVTENVRGPERFIDLPKYPEMLSNAYGSWFFVFFIVLLAGAGSIAADNRSNAQQIYLSKAITKRDYLIGKWMSIFLVMFAVVFIPMFSVTCYAAFNLGLGDFMRQYGTLFPKIFVIAAIPATVHACVMLGISAWNKAPTIAGLIYVGIFLAWNLFAQIVAALLHDSLSREMRRTVDYFSIQGSISGLGQNVIGAMPRQFFDRHLPPQLPAWQPLLALAIVACVLGLAAARARIRAVDVVKS